MMPTRVITAAVLSNVLLHPTLPVRLPNLEDSSVPISKAPPIPTMQTLAVDADIVTGKQKFVMQPTFATTESLTHAPFVSVLKSEPHAKALSALLNYRNLQANWDGEGALAPFRGAVDDAIELLRLVPEHLPAPKTMALPSGHIALYWRIGKAYAEIGVDGSGKYYGYATKPDMEEVYIDDAPLFVEAAVADFPEEIEKILV